MVTVDRALRTERLTILLTADEKAAMVARAQQLGMTTSDLLRFAYQSLQPESVELMQGLAREVEQSVMDARKAVADAHQEVSATLAVTRRDTARAA